MLDEAVVVSVWVELSVELGGSLVCHYKFNFPSQIGFHYENAPDTLEQYNVTTTN